MVETNLEKGVFLEIIFLIFIWMLVYFLGGQLSKLLPGDFQEIAPFLCLTCEGGAVALPLYISVVGKSYTANLIPFDIAGILINFIFVPLILMNKSIGERKLLPFARKIFTSSFILAVLFGVCMNASGLHQVLMQNIAKGKEPKATKNAWPSLIQAVYNQGLAVLFPQRAK